MIKQNKFSELSLYLFQSFLHVCGSCRHYILKSFKTITYFCSKNISEKRVERERELMAIKQPQLSCTSPAWTREDTSGPVLTLLPMSLMLTGLTLILLCPLLSDCGCCCFAGPMNMAAFQHAHHCLRHPNLGDSARTQL